MRAPRLFSRQMAALPAVLAIWVAVAVVGPAFFGPDDLAITLSRAWAAPTLAHPLGCDGLGRDLLARLTDGARTALVIAAPAVLLAIFTGGGLGVAASVLGRGAETAVGRMGAAALSFPRLVLALALGVILGEGIAAVAAAFVLASWPAVAQQTVAQITCLRKEPYVLAAKAMGASAGHIVRRHILPGLWAGWLARAGGLAAQAVMLESALSFLGLGVQEPQTSWGGMVRDGLSALNQHPTQALASGGAIFLTALATNLAADATARRIDPRRRHKNSA